MTRRTVGLLTTVAALVAGSATAWAAAPAPLARGTGAASYGIEYTAYSGDDVSALVLAGTLPVNGLAVPGVLSSPGCWMYGGAGDCTAPVTGVLGAHRVTGSCVVTPTPNSTPPLLERAFAAPPQFGGLTLQCDGTVGARAWSTAIQVTAATTGDPTYSPASQIGPPPLSESFAGRYVTAS